MDSNPEVAHPTRMDNCSPRYESILNKPPHPLTPGLVSHCSAELPKTVLMPSSRRKDGGKPRGLGLIDLVDAPFNELDQLALLCEPTSLGVDEDSEAMTATDQLYRDNDKVGKMNPGSFSPLLVPVQTNLVKILGATTSKATNRVRDRTSSFGSSTSTDLSPSLASKPRLGSLVVVFPTPHGGGVLSLRSRYYEGSFDPSRKIAAAAHAPSIGYVVLL
ncbi:hypothetical protein V8E52_010890 [Russula decolorans]